MTRSIVLLAIGVLFGAGLGFLLAAGSGMEEKANPVHDHSAHDHGGGMHHATLTEVEGDAPTLALSLHPDGPQSRNLHLKVTGFTFAPEAVNGAHVPGEGHAHVYVNDIKFARAYGPWVHLDALPKGRHVIRVTLNANDHSQLALEGAPIDASLEVTIE